MAGLPPSTLDCFLSLSPHSQCLLRACVITDVDKGTPSVGLMVEEGGRAPPEAGE